MTKIKNILGGFLIGAAIGVTVGMLTAPSSGRRTRNDFLKKSRKLRATIGNSINSLRQTYNQKVDEYASTGKQSIDSIKEKVKV